MFKMQEKRGDKKNMLDKDFGCWWELKEQIENQ